MLFYRVFVLLLSANFYQQYEQIRNPNLFIVSTHNYSRDFTLNKLSVSAYEVTFANDLYIDIFTTLFYHLKHNRIVPLSIPVEFKQRHHRLLLILILSGDISVNPGPPKHPCGSSSCRPRTIQHDDFSQLAYSNSRMDVWVVQDLPKCHHWVSR